MSLRRFFLLPFTMLALAFAANAPAAAFERSHDAYEIAIVTLDFDLAMVPITDQVAELRNEQSLIGQPVSTPVRAALGPIYALSLMTDGQSLVHPPHRRC